MFKHWTPIDAASGVRLNISLADVEVVSGSLGRRGLGYRGVVRWNGGIWRVRGAPCGARNCNCDAKIERMEASTSITGLKVALRGAARTDEERERLNERIGQLLHARSGAVNKNSVKPV